MGVHMNTRDRIRPRRALIVVPVLSLVGACDSDGTDGSTEMEIHDLVVGRLAGDPRTGCMWLGDRMGGSTDVAVAWGPDAQVRADPLRVVDLSNGLIAHRGDQIEADAGPTDDSAIEPPCRIGAGTSSLRIYGLVKVTPKATFRIEQDAAIDIR
jgi:hypothetical protein